MGIFLSFFKAGTIGFGGGSALIPVVEKEVVREEGGVSPEDFLKHTVIANITPGALPVKLGGTCGYQMGGPIDAVLGAFGVSIPGALLTVLLMVLLSVSDSSIIRYFSYAAVGISTFIVFLLLSYVVRTVKSGTLAINLLLCFGALALIRRLHVSTIQLMLIAFTGILLKSWLDAACSKREKPTKPVTGRRIRIPKGIWFTVLAFLAIPVALSALIFVFCSVPVTFFEFVSDIALSTITSFGGGEAYVSIADGFFVESGLISAESFYNQLVPVANALPGPILVKLTAGMGYLYGNASGGMLLGLLLAAVSASLSIGCCTSVAVLLSSVYDSVKDSLYIKNLQRYILPIICGMLLSTSGSLLRESLKITGEKGIGKLLSLAAMLIAVVILYVLHKKYKTPDIVFLSGCAVLSFIVLFFM